MYTTNKNPDERRVREKKEKHEHNIKNINVMVSMLERNMARQTCYKDPATQSCIFFEKLLTVTDVAKVFITESCLDSDQEMPVELSTRIEKLIGEFDNNIQKLIDMIQNPSLFSPNHPYGNSYMEAAKNDFESAKPDTLAE